MCRKLFYYFLNNSKLDWLKKKSTNPYAIHIDKIDVFLWSLSSIPIFLLFLLAGKYSCSAALLLVSFFAMELGLIRHIKTTYADIESPVMRPLLCYNQILLIFVTAVILFNVVKCLAT